MLDSFIDILRQYPALAVFLTLGTGFFIGKIRIGNFSLGSVTAVLLVGVLVGQLKIPVSGPLKMFFFLLFLFSIGYSVGPDFFKSLRGQGLRQAIFAVVMSSVCFGVTVSIAWLMGYTKGETIGLFSGSQTCSSLMGVGSEALGRLGLSPDQLSREINIIPVCYAVTYIFGTLGTVIILGNFGPKLLGGLDYVKDRTAELEKQLNDTGRSDDPAYVNALIPSAYRAFVVVNPYFSTPRTVRETEAYLHDRGADAVIDKVRHNGIISPCRHDDIICLGDEIVIGGRRELVINANKHLGREIFDTELLSYSLERIGIVVAKKGFIGHKISELRNKKYLHGVVIRDAVRNGRLVEINRDTVFCKGDRITVIGRPSSVAMAVPHIGYPDRRSFVSDLMFVGLAIFIGGLFGALSLWVGNMPLSLGTSGGALLAGLVFGWLRSRRPTYGHIPPGALWFMNNMGLNVFIAVVGIEAAPSFVSGIKAIGPMLFVVGAVGTSIPLLIGLWLGRKVFRFNPAITLGCCAGTRTCTASLGAVQETLGSTIPTIGYTVTYAVSNLLLVIWGLVAVTII